MTQAESYATIRGNLPCSFAPLISFEADGIPSVIICILLSFSREREIANRTKRPRHFTLMNWNGIAFSPTNTVNDTWPSVGNRSTFLQNFLQQKRASLLIASLAWYGERDCLLKSNFNSNLNRNFNSNFNSFISNFQVANKRWKNQFQV